MITRLLTATAGAAALIALAGCGDDTLFNDRPPIPSSYGSTDAPAGGGVAAARPPAPADPAAAPAHGGTPGS